MVCYTYYIETGDTKMNTITFTLLVIMGLTLWYGLSSLAMLVGL